MQRRRVKPQGIQERNSAHYQRIIGLANRLKRHEGDKSPCLNSTLPLFPEKLTSTSSVHREGSGVADGGVLEENDF